VIVAPEGTRSKTGILQKGKGGIVKLALISGAPIIPIAHFGGQNIWENMKHFKRTPFTFRVGTPFYLKCEGRPGKEVQEAMLNEIMIQIARLLPKEMRGEYAALAGTECRYLEFIEQKSEFRADSGTQINGLKTA
jgi:1-acyl-sn-glycerol-3-phosphate acyltransferase